MKAPICGDFFRYDWSNGQSRIMRLRGSRLSEEFNTKNKQRHEIFMWKSKLKKIKGRRKRIHYFQEITMNFLELYSEPIPSLTGGECLFVLNCWPGGGWSAVEFDVITTIFMCEFNVTATIVGASLLWSPSKRSYPIHSCPGWRAFSCYECGKS